MLSPDDLLQNRYRILRRFGEGGQGAVYQAFDERLKIQVALKQVFFNDERSLKAFESEARLLARLKHDALPRVIDHFPESGEQFLVMEFIPGDDLFELLKKHGRAFPATDVLMWARQLLDVLNYLHRQQPPVIHRDIKPQNLKLDSRGRIVLLDFGLAKDTGSSTVLRGYSHYYAPLEQKRLRGTDARSDLYAVGATLYHLLTGQLPEDAEIRDAAINDGKVDPLILASSLNAEVTGGVANWIAQAMSLDREHRQSSATAMREQLDKLLQPGAAGESLKTTEQIPNPIASTLLDPIEDLTESLPQPALRQPITEPVFTTRKMPPPIQPQPAALTTNVEPKPDPVPKPNRALIAAAIAGLIVIAAAIWFWAKNGDNSKTQLATNGQQTAAPAAKPVVAMRYWLEVFDRNGNASRATGLTELTDAQTFRFHFSPGQAGYLYLIAPGKQNAPMTLLTALPALQTGVRSNRLEANEDWEFPRGNDAAFGADRTLLEYPTTVIFSPHPLKDPSFLSATAIRELNLTEQRELETWLKQFNNQSTDTAPETSMDDASSRPLMVVRAMPDQLNREPLIFRIKVKRH